MRLLVDEDFNHHILRGLLRRIPELDAKTALALGLDGRDDVEILRAAERDGRLVLSHDVNTMTAAIERLRAAGEPTPGLLLVPQSLPIGAAIDDLELICMASGNHEWTGAIAFLPL